jgi:dTDP-4-amino-4,6-dideoxygalactose transaminase
MFEVVQTFEKEIAYFFGAPYAVAVDSCTHAIELALRHGRADKISVPRRTYISIPFLAPKLGLKLEWRDEDWIDYYFLTPNVVDAAVLWRRDSYMPGTMMGVSFQYQKHLSLGRGGVLLLDDADAAEEIKKMSYDGRLPNVPWREQNISTLGYHYYMTPETAQLGIDKLALAIKSTPKQWVVTDWPDLSLMNVFTNGIHDGD